MLGIFTTVQARSKETGESEPGQQFGKELTMDKGRKKENDKNRVDNGGWWDDGEEIQPLIYDLLLEIQKLCKHFLSVNKLNYTFQMKKER